MEQYSINSKCRSLGWTYSPVARNGCIDQPTKPEYTGSVKSICQQIQADRQFQADKENLRYSVQWFYRGQPITSIDNGVYSSNDASEIDTIIKSLDATGATIYTENKAVYTAPKPTKQYKINSKTRSLGWAYSASETDKNLAAPTTPTYSGTIPEVFAAIKNNAQFKADKKTLAVKVQWFFSGRPITQVKAGALVTTDQKEIGTTIKDLQTETVTAYTEEPKRGKGKPRTLPIENCPKCGKVMRSNGKTKPDKDGHRKQRYKCKACGHNLTVGGGSHGGPRAESFNPPDKPPLTNAERQASFQKRKREKAAAKEKS